MSDPSTSDIVNANLYNSTAFERELWNKSGTEARYDIIKDLDFKDIQVSQYEIASEHAYQQEHTAKLNELTKTNYNSLPAAVRAFVTEALIADGKLPNPSDFTGIGNEFVANPRGIVQEVFIECDRCDEEFMSEEDFKTHKDIDHGDVAEELHEESEDSFASLMDEDLSKEELQEARRLLAENNEMPDFGRDTVFNGKDLPQATAYTPDDVKGERGYDDNPNEFFYDNKKFKRGSSADRYGGMVSEAYDEGLCQTCGKTPVEHENADHTFQHRMAKAVGADGMAEPTIIVNPAEGGIDDNEITLGDIEYVNVPSATDEPIEMLKEVDFAEEKIDFIYPTKATEEFVEKKDPYLEDYGDDDIESEEEAVEAQIINRKLSGINPQNIARELVIRYGCPMEEAVERVSSIEVSTDDLVANTFFGKRLNECTEAEIQELQLYSGSDD